MAGSLRSELTDGVLTVTLDRPRQLNALTGSMQHELAGLWSDARLDDSVRCVVVTGAGRAFCAGLDVAELSRGPAPAGTATRVRFCPAETVDVPVVVAINGLCIGGGLRFLADADIAIAADNAWFADPHVSVGQLGTPIAVQLAAKASSFAVAQLFLAGSGLRMPAAQALAAGLLSEVVPAAVLADRAHELASLIARQSPTAVRATVAALRRSTRAPIEAEMSDAWTEVVAQRAHPDAAEGASAIAQGRPPSWARPAAAVGRDAPRDAPRDPVRDVPRDAPRDTP